LQLDIYYT